MILLPKVRSDVSISIHIPNTEWYLSDSDMHSHHLETWMKLSLWLSLPGTQQFSEHSHRNFSWWVSYISHHSLLRIKLTVAPIETENKKGWKSCGWGCSWCWCIMESRNNREILRSTYMVQFERYYLLFIV